MQVGFIGTGLMGNAMARLLIEAGHQLTVHDVRREATTNLCEMGARWADSPRAVAAASEVVFTSLPGPAEVEEVVFRDKDGLLTGLRSGSVYIDTTTNSPSLLRRLAAACGERGASVLDAPVTGRPPQMTVFVGGDEATLARCRPLLEPISQHIFYMGPVGNGMVAKGVNQFLIFGGFLLGAEGLLIGAKAGIDVKTLYEALAVGGGGRSVRLDEFARIVFKGDFTRVPGGSGPVERWVKDASCAAEAAHAVGAPAPFLTIAYDLLRRAQAQGWDDQVWYIVVRVLEQMAGVQLRSPTEA